MSNQINFITTTSGCARLQGFSGLDFGEVPVVQSIPSPCRVPILGARVQSDISLVFVQLGQLLTTGGGGPLCSPSLRPTLAAFPQI